MKPISNAIIHLFLQLLFCPTPVTISLIFRSICPSSTREVLVEMSLPPGGQNSNNSEVDPTSSRPTTKYYSSICASNLLTTRTQTLTVPLAPGKLFLCFKNTIFKHSDNFSLICNHKSSFSSCNNHTQKVICDYSLQQISYWPKLFRRQEVPGRIENLRERLTVT